MHLQFKIHRHTQRENIEKEEPTKKNKQEYPKKDQFDGEKIDIFNKKKFFFAFKKVLFKFHEVFHTFNFTRISLADSSFFYLDTKHFFYFCFKTLQ